MRPTSRWSRRRWPRRSTSRSSPGSRAARSCTSSRPRPSGLRLAAGEPFRRDQRRTIENAAVLADALAERGARIVSGGTDNHLMLVDVTPLGVTGKEAEALLDEVGVTVNKNAIPFDPLPPNTSSGIRLGHPGDDHAGLRARGDAGDRAGHHRRDPPPRRARDPRPAASRGGGHRRALPCSRPVPRGRRVTFAVAGGCGAPTHRRRLPRRGADLAPRHPADPPLRDEPADPGSPQSAPRPQAATPAGRGRGGGRGLRRGRAARSSLTACSRRGRSRSGRSAWRTCSACSAGPILATVVGALDDRFDLRARWQFLGQLGPGRHRRGGRDHRALRRRTRSARATWSSRPRSRSGSRSSGSWA